eukprot:Rhum_TRINITY_DN14728_c0_g1::Rhum_TRINITY_DN14728_c0_g1_i2::g.111720::m.111720
MEKKRKIKGKKSEKRKALTFFLYSPSLRMRHHKNIHRTVPVHVVTRSLHAERPERAPLVPLHDDTQLAVHEAAARLRRLRELHVHASLHLRHAIAQGGALPLPRVARLRRPLRRRGAPRRTRRHHQRQLLVERQLAPGSVGTLLSVAQLDVRGSVPEHVVARPLHAEGAERTPLVPLDHEARFVPAQATTLVRRRTRQPHLHAPVQVRHAVLQRRPAPLRAAPVARRLEGDAQRPRRRAPLAPDAVRAPRPQAAARPGRSRRPLLRPAHLREGGVRAADAARSAAAAAASAAPLRRFEVVVLRLADGRHGEAVPVPRARQHAARRAERADRAVAAQARRRQRRHGFAAAAGAPAASGVAEAAVVRLRLRQRERRVLVARVRRERRVHRTRRERRLCSGGRLRSSCARVLVAAALPRLAQHRRHERDARAHGALAVRRENVVVARGSRGVEGDLLAREKQRGRLRVGWAVPGKPFTEVRSGGSAAVLRRARGGRRVVVARGGSARLRRREAAALPEQQRRCGVAVAVRRRVRRRHAHARRSTRACQCLRGKLLVGTQRLVEACQRHAVVPLERQRVARRVGRVRRCAAHGQHAERGHQDLGLCGVLRDVLQVQRRDTPRH